MQTEGQIGGVHTTARVQDGRVLLRAEGDSDVYVQAPRNQPLSAGEPHCRLKVSGNGQMVEVSLDGAQLDALVDALYYIREGDDD